MKKNYDYMCLVINEVYKVKVLGEVLIGVVIVKEG